MAKVQSIPAEVGQAGGEAQALESSEGAQRVEQAASLERATGLEGVSEMGRALWSALLTAQYRAWESVTGLVETRPPPGRRFARTVLRAIGLQASRVSRSVTILRSREDVIRAFRNLEGMPRLLRRLDQEEPLRTTRSRWAGRRASREPVAWEVETVPGADETLSFRSVAPPELVQAGTVDFSSAPGNRGTEVRVILEGPVFRRGLRKLAGRILAQPAGRKLRGDLRRVKQSMETGEIATIEGQPSGREGQ